MDKEIILYKRESLVFCLTIFTKIIHQISAGQYHTVTVKLE